MSKRPHLLLTNDDGINAPGLYSLWRSLKDHYEITIVAPAMNQSGKGLSITLRRPLHIKQVAWEENTKAYQVDGTPADCVKLGLTTLFSSPPDFIASGINCGSNSGRTVLYSGTVGGVIEGVMQHIPGVAFSCDSGDNPHYERTEELIPSLVHYALEHPLPQGSFFNVTFPDHDGPIKGVKMARQGKTYWMADPKERQHPEGHSYYWLGGKLYDHPEHEDSDVKLVAEGYVSIVPIHVHELTDHAQLELRKASFDARFAKL